MTTLHYIFDPLCGWCYAAAPLVAAARDVPGIDVALHGGGMMTGDNRRNITPQWRDHVMPHDRRIAQLSGQPFGSGYFDGLLNDNSAVMDSAPPTTAVLAAEQMSARGLDMLHRLQHAHYVEGLRIAHIDMLSSLAGDIGLDVAAFDQAFTELAGAGTEAHFAASRALLAKVGGQGFPTFALQHANGRTTRLDASGYLGKPDEWTARLAQLIQANRFIQPRRDRVIQEHPMSHIAILGITGRAGSRIANELLQRGHTVTGIARDISGVSPRDGLAVKAGDATQAGAIATLLSGHDAVVSATRFDGGSDAATTIAAAKQAGVPRLLVVGGAGSLEVAPGVSLVDTPKFPVAYKAEALAGRVYLDALRGETALDWTFLSPSALFETGERTGKFRVGGDQLLTGADGASRITMEDYAIALVDEIESPRHSRARFTVGY